MRSAFLLLVLVAMSSVLACANGARECYPTDWRACRCGEADGYQQCDAAGEAYGTCDCSGTIPGLTSSASSTSTGGGGDAAKLPFMSECTTDDDCESGLCYPFNAKGLHCSMPCDAQTTCPPPSPGCSLMGVCKAP